MVKSGNRHINIQTLQYTGCLFFVFWEKNPIELNCILQSEADLQGHETQY